MPRQPFFRNLPLGLHEKQRPLLRSLKVVLALVLLGFVIMQVHWQDYPVTDEAGRVVTCPGLLSCLVGVDAGWLLAAFVVSVGSLLVSALRWRLLLAVQDVHVSIREVIKLQFLGEFFSTVIPGMVGGDLVKAYCVMQKTTQKANVLVSVFVDRLLGICGMVCMAVAMLAALWATGQLEGRLLRYSAPSVAMVSAGAGAALVLLLSPRLRRLFRLQKLYARLPIAAHIAQAGDAVRRYRARPAALVQAFLISLLAQVLGSAFVVLLGIALDLDVPWTHYFLHVPLILIISAVPITPGGIGVMEQLYLLYFAAAGNPSLVLALAVLVRAVTLAGALPGGLVALSSGFTTPRPRDPRAGLSKV